MPPTRRINLNQRLALGLLLLANVGVFGVLGVLAVSGGRLGEEALAAPLADEARGTPSPTLPAPTPSATPTALPGLTVTASTPDALPTSLPSPTALPSDTPTPEPLALVPPPPPELPARALITNIVGRRQTYSLSCEARSAADWAGYFGFSIDELDFHSRLPLSDDPDLGFVGDVNGVWGQIPPYSYGVHAMPVADLLKQYGVKARARRGLEWEAVRAEVAAGEPVIVWVVGHVERGGERVLYRAASGHVTYVARFEHTVIVVGYTEETVTVLDNGQVYTRSLETFLEAWLPLGNMAVLYVGP
jgi:uncharacterized protein YvpB